jgi:hypothetical protein
MARIHATGAVLAGVFALALSTPAAAAGAAPGAAPGSERIVSYKFHTPPMNSAGVTDLADVRGRPVLIDFWGTR